MKSVIDNSFFIFLGLFLFTLIVRLPYFAQSVVDWDESTYILMGADLLRGHLPYVHLWELKPPLAFLHYALFLLLFGKSIVAVRLGGLLCVFISAFLLYRIGAKIYSTSVGIWLAVIHIILASVINGQATMTEHLILIPLVLSLEIFLLKPFSYKNSFSLGLLSGYMVLTRTDMAFFSLALGMTILLWKIKQHPKSSIVRVLFFSGGNSAPIGLMCLLYFLDNNFPLFFKSFVTAALAYALQNPASLWLKVASFLGMSIHALFFPIGFVTVLSAAFGILIILFRPHHLLVVDRRKSLSLVIMVVSLCLPIIVIGLHYQEYLIMAFPPLILTGGAALSFLFASRFKRTILMGLFLSLLPVMTQSAYEWRRVGYDLISGQYLFRDPGYLVADYLNRQVVSGQYVYFLDYHIGYFLTNSKIPTKYAHPSDIAKEFLIKAFDGKDATPERTLQDILDNKPIFIIRGERIWYFDKMCKACNALLQDALDKSYELDRKIGGMYIYKVL